LKEGLSASGLWYEVFFGGSTHNTINERDIGQKAAQKSEKESGGLRWRR